MGRFALFILQVVFIFSLELRAEVFHEVNIEPETKLGSAVLPFRGKALRTATWFKIKVYVISLYAKEPVNLSNIEANLPLKINVVFVRDVNEKDTDEAWLFQFKESNTHKYEKLNADVKALTDAFTVIKKGQVFSFNMTKDLTEITQDNLPIGSIQGADFQKAFLSLWIGEKAVSEEIKANLSK